jgi:hypothetical protein
VHVLDAATARFDILNREQIRAQHEMAEMLGHLKETDMLEHPKAFSTYSYNYN